MAILELHEIRKHYGGAEIIKGIELTIRDREFIVFVGPSGCGKSTLLRMIAGLEEITDGDLKIDGERVNATPPDRRGLAMVFQSYALYPHMTVAENMSFALRLAGVAKEERNKKVSQAARILELEPLLDRKPKQLSGGQRQRVAIGRAIVREPKAFLFDEPLSNLDAALRVQMRLEIAKLHRELNATMIYVTHDQVEAMTLADRIVVLNHGRIEQVGTPLELYQRPANLFVAGFIGSPKMNFLGATVTANKDGRALLALDGGSHFDTSAEGVRVGERVTVGLRPEYLSIDATGSIAATVESVEYLGDAIIAYTSIGDRAAAVSVKAPPEARISVGDSVRIAVQPGAAILFDADGQALHEKEAKALWSSAQPATAAQAQGPWKHNPNGRLAETVPNLG
jgi:multiple sugar transport system ATP-binding protein